MAEYKVKKGFENIHHAEGENLNTKVTRLGDADESELKRLLHKDYKVMSKYISGKFDKEFVAKQADTKKGEPLPTKPAATSKKANSEKAN